MNIQESNDVNTVITSLLWLCDNPHMNIKTDGLCQAMIRAGIDGDSVRRSWPKPPGWPAPEK